MIEQPLNFELIEPYFDCCVHTEQLHHSDLNIGILFRNCMVSPRPVLYFSNIEILFELTKSSKNRQKLLKKSQV